MGVLGRRIENASRRGISLVGHHIVGDSHFDVVGFSGKQVQRLVLRFPAELADSSVIRTLVEVSADAQI